MAKKAAKKNKTNTPDNTTENDQNNNVNKSTGTSDDDQNNNNNDQGGDTSETNESGRYIKVRMLKTQANPNGVRLAGKPYEVTEEEFEVLKSSYACVEIK